MPAKPNLKKRGRPAKGKSESESQVSTKGFLSADALIAHINKKFGKNVMMRASDALSLVKSYVSTGAAALDILLGGGLQEGKLHQFRGNFSSTKTTHMQKTACNYLKKHPEGVFVYVDAENAHDIQRLIDLGFSKEMLQRTFIVTPDSGENAADIAIEAAQVSQKAIIGIDSVDAMTPTAEQENGMDKQSMGLAARMMNKFMRKLIPVMVTDLLSDNPRCTVVMICQLREKIGVMFGDPSTTSGGKGKEFAASTIVKFSRVSWLKEGDKTSGKTYGMRIQAEIIKCRGPAHGETTEYDYYKMNFRNLAAGEFDNTEAIYGWGVRLGLVNKAAKTYTFGKWSATGEQAFIDGLVVRPKLTARLLEEIMEERRKLYTPKIRNTDESDSN